MSAWEFLVYMTGQQPMSITWAPILALAALIGCVVELSAGRPLSRLLPKDWTSVRTDVLLWVGGRLFGLLPKLGVPVLTLAAAVSWIGDPAGARPGLAAWIALGLVHLCWSDFVYWVLHWLRHRYAVLWAFHAVHHSADYLNPLTSFRRHPVEATMLLTVLNLVGSLPLVGIVWLYPGVDAARVTVFAVVQLGFVVGWANLLHSQVWWSFGPVVERVLISPAMHQIHHSRVMEECMTNYGQMLSVWDGLFGTRLMAHEVPLETLELGVDGVEHVTLWQIFVEPLIESWRALRAALGATG